MAAQNIQPMPAFEPRSDPTSTSARWTRWLERFNTYLLAADIKDDARKRALLLYQAGPEVHKIFKTLEEGETKDFKSAVKALTEYFEPEKNVIYRTYVFRQAMQGKEESIDEFHTCLRGLAKYCEFTNIDFEIKMQIVTNGTSSRLRKKALQDPKYSLANMLIDGRKYKTSSAQAVGIEEQFKTRENINATNAMAMTTPTEKKCYYCGFKYPHDNQPCPAKSVEHEENLSQVRETLRNYKRKVLPPQTKGANHDGMRINNENNKQRLLEYHKANQILKARKKRIMFTQYRKKRRRKHTRP
ncbi:Hypothetical predicted protein [Paramuricea clavata]|uniref:Uncharacterized protein n=1 Tax=Paramuricea clavata TaxID=317549 RepID=A0A7D9K528_PARCT|nr:Hypothetical predicted protein [Paramuricea clavata]